jgi:hypothetical protein
MNGTIRASLAEFTGTFALVCLAGGAAAARTGPLLSLINN